MSAVQLEDCGCGSNAVSSRSTYLPHEKQFLAFVECDACGTRGPVVEHGYGLPDRLRAHRAAVADWNRVRAAGGARHGIGDA